MPNQFDRIEDVTSLFNAASEFHKRLLRMSPKASGETIASLNVLNSMAKAAQKLEIASPFSYSARGVVFLQKKDEILAGDRPLKHIEAESFAGYIAHQARRACHF